MNETRSTSELLKGKGGDLMQKQPDNAEPTVKCPNCGNMVFQDEEKLVCQVCGNTFKVEDGQKLYASNEDY